MTYTELALPLTNSRGLAKFIRFDYQSDNILKPGNFVAKKMPIGNGKEEIFNDGNYDWVTHFLKEATVMPLVVSPYIFFTRKPYYTRQTLYFLSDIDCVIRTMIPVPEGVESDDTQWKQKKITEFQQAADDCLFEYSLQNLDYRLTTRSNPLPVTIDTYETNAEVTCIYKDDTQRQKYLSLDNGRVEIAYPDTSTQFENLYSSYLNRVYKKPIELTTSDNKDDSPYYISKASLLNTEISQPIKFYENPYTFDELTLLSKVIPVTPEIVLHQKDGNLDKRSFRENWINLFNQAYKSQLREFPPDKWPNQEIKFVSNSYNPVLLDFYFAGLRSLSPIIEFRDYYSIIEYFFEDAAFSNLQKDLDEKIGKLKSSQNFGEYSKELDKLKSKCNLLQKENEQIREVINHYIDVERIKKFFGKELSKTAKNHFETYNHTVSGKAVQRLKTNNPDLLSIIADRIYQFRNAIFHAKRTRKGQETQSFRPFSEEEMNVIRYEALLLRIVAQEIIKKTEVDV